MWTYTLPLEGSKSLWGEYHGHKEEREGEEKKKGFWGGGGKKKEDGFEGVGWHKRVTRVEKGEWGFETFWKTLGEDHCRQELDYVGNLERVEDIGKGSFSYLYLIRVG